MEHPAEVFLGILSFACREPCLRGFARAADGACHPVASDPTCDSGSPTYDSSPDTDEPEVELPLVLGDPIETVDGELEPYVEWLDAVVIDKTRAIVAGVSGWAWYDLENHVRLAEHSSGRTYRVAVDRDTQRAFFATRADRIVVVDVSTDTPTPVDLPGWVTEGFHEDISADGGVVLLGALDEGLVVMDSDLNRLATVPADTAFGVSILDGRGLFADGDELVLLDLSEPSNPVELDRASLRGTGRDIDFDGADVAVAMGGSGVDVFEVVDDALVATGELDVPGSAFGVSLDGDWLWVAAWEVTALAWLGDGGPVVVGHEDPLQSAMGIGAYEGVVAVADWQSLTVLQHNEGLAGPELHDPSPIWVESGSTENVAVVITNWGALELELSLTTTSDFELSTGSLSLSPSGSEVIQLTPPGDQGEQAVIDYTSNDPDETSGQIVVRAKSTQIGSTHPDFELLGFTPPETALSTYALSDYLGQVVLLDYFTTW